MHKVANRQGVIPSLSQVSDREPTTQDSMVREQGGLATKAN